MANEESFMLVSLEESKAKKLAQVISNDTSRKILDYLAKKDHATETDMSKELKIPLSTVHYNLKALVEANLVTADEYHYSEKGKEINHYALTNKLIIIAPKEKSGLKESLKKFFPISIIAVAAAGIISLFSNILGKSENAVLRAAPEMMIADTAAEAVPTIAAKTAPLMAQETVVQASQTTLLPDTTLWFLFGALFVILLYLLFEWIKSLQK